MWVEMDWHFRLLNFGWIGLVPMLGGVNWHWSIGRLTLNMNVNLIALPIVKLPKQRLMTLLLKLIKKRCAVVFLCQPKILLKQQSFTLEKNGTGVYRSFGDMQRKLLEVSRSCGWVVGEVFPLGFYIFVITSLCCH